MKCQESKQMIHTYLDGELSKHEEQALYNHMATCSVCQLDMDRAKELQNLLEKAIVHIEPPRDFVQMVMANLPDKIDKNAQAEVLAELDLFKEESVAEETVKDSAKNIKETKKIFRFDKRWIGIAAGLVFAFFAATGAYQAIEIARTGPVDPTPPAPPEYNDMQRDEDSQQEDNNSIMMAYDNIDNQQVDIPEEQNTPSDAIDSRQNNQIENIIARVADDIRSNNGINGEIVRDNDSTIENIGNDGIEVADNEAANQDITPPDAEIDAPSAITSQPITAVGRNPTSTVTLNQLLENVLGATWGSDGNSLLYLVRSDNGNIRAFESPINSEDRRSVGTYGAVGIWSPDRNYMAYTQNIDGRSSIWVESRNGKRNLTPEVVGARSGGSGWAYNPVWSSRNEIAFLTDRFGGTDIMVVNMEGNSRRITFLEGDKDNLVWSPDGSQIAYFRSWENEGSRVGEIVVASVHGEISRRVTPVVRASNMVATWSPDGNILAVNVTGEQQGIWMTNTNESGWDRNLTTRGGGRAIEWSPDGQKIAFSDSQGVFHILVWRSAQTNADIIQLPPMGGQMANASIEWSRDSNTMLMKQPIAESDKKSVWMATLPRAVSAY